MSGETAKRDWWTDVLYSVNVLSTLTETLLTWTGTGTGRKDQLWLSEEFVVMLSEDCRGLLTNHNQSLFLYSSSSSSVSLWSCSPWYKCSLPSFFGNSVTAKKCLRHITRHGEYHVACNKRQFHLPSLFQLSGRPRNLSLLHFTRQRLRILCAIKAWTGEYSHISPVQSPDLTSKIGVSYPIFALPVRSLLTLRDTDGEYNVL